MTHKPQLYANDRRMWHQQPGESSRAYKCFMVYLEMGIDRTLIGAYRQETGKTHAQNSSGTWTRWYTIYEWKKRAQEYDAWTARQRLTRRQKALMDAEDRNARLAAKIKERAAKRLNTIPLAELPPSVAVAAYKEAVKIENESLGKTQNVAVELDHTVNAPKFPPELLRDPAILEALDAISQRMEEEGGLVVEEGEEKID